MTVYKRGCNYCGKYYEGQGKSFCSRSCMKESGVCVHTGEKEIERRRKIGEWSRGQKRSKEWCQAISRGQKLRKRLKKPKPRRTCQHCGIEYEGQGKMFCSAAC